MLQNKTENTSNKKEKIKHLKSKPNCKLKKYNNFILNFIWYTCHSKITRYALVTLLSLIIYLPCLNNEFVFDDVPTIVQNQVVQQKNPLNNFIQLFLTDYWGTPIYKEESHKSYRPFTIFTFRLNFWFSKLNPFGYQLTNIILHSINSLLNYNFVSQFLDAESSLFASLLFALHPIHVDAVASIVGRAELLSALFVLIVFNWRLTIKKQLPLSYLCCLTIIGLLSKEQGITILPLIIVYETLFLKENNFLKIKINEKSFLLNFVDLTFKIFYFLFDFSKKITHFSQILLTIFMTLNDKFNFHLKLKVNFQKKKLNNLAKKSKKKSTKNALKSDLLFYETLFYNSINSKYVQKIFVLFILILFLRVRVLHKDLPKFSRFDNPMISLSFPYRQLNYINIWSFNFYKMLNPYSLACDWSAESIHLITSASDFNIIYLIIIFISFFYFVRRIFALRDFKILFFFLFNIITFLPASNIFFTVGFVFAERILYLPSIGLCALIACSYQKILISLKANLYKDKNSKNLISFLRLIISLLCILFAIRSWLRTYDWKSDYQLYKSDIKTNPNNTKLLNNLGKIFEKNENYDLAFKYYEHAILIQPDDSRGTLNCANLHSKLRNYQKAELYYRQAIKSIPGLELNKNQNETKINYSILNNINSKFNFHHSSSYKLSNTHSSTFNENIVFLNKKYKIEQFVSTMQLRAALNLANLLSNNPLKKSEANQLYEKLIAIKPDHGATYLSWIESILKSNSRDLRTMKHVLVHLLTNAKHLDVNVLYNVAVLISNSGNSMMALQLFDQILKLHPKHEEALLTSARIIRKNSEFNQLHEVAIERLEKFVSLNQLDHNVFFELGMLYINSNIQKSIEYLQKAIQLKPQFSEALFNLSLLLYKQERASEAIPFLELLLKYDESHQKAMILLFSINSNQ